MTDESTLHERRNRRLVGTRRGLTAVAAAAISTLVLSACGSSSSSSAPSTTAVSPKHPVTLVVEDGDGGETPLINAYAALNKQFEAAHPGVKVDFVVKSFNDLVDTLKLQLSGSSGVPAVTQANQGYSSLGALVTDGLVRNLSSIAKADDWSARQPASLLNLDGAFNNGGKTMGTGPLWGISSTGTWVGLFENTAIAKKLGITSAPTTLAQLQQDLAIAHSHGVLGIDMGTTDYGEPAWLLYELMMAQTTPQTLSNITDGVSTTLPSSVTSAAETIQTWQQDGYLTPGSASFASTDAFNQFLAGKGLFVLSGSWDVPLPGPASKSSKYHMILFPMEKANQLAAVGSGDMPWAIPTHSPYPQLAAEYINFITSPAANKAWIDAGQVPASLSPNELSEASGAHLSTASEEALVNWVNLLKMGYPEPYVDWSTPTFLNTIGQSLQELIGGKISPSAVQSALQADYGPFTEQRHSAS